MILQRILKNLVLKFEILWKYRRQFSNLRQNIKLGEKILRHGSVIWIESNDFSKLIIITLAVNLTHLRAINKLCRAGLAKDALIVLRVMFEDTCNFNYIHNDKKRLQDFMDYDSYQRLKMGNNVDSKLVKDPKRFEARKKELEQEWNKVKSHFTHKNGRVFKNWSGKSLREICKELDGEENYNYLYHFLSHFVHPSFISAGEYILGMDDRNHVVAEIGQSYAFVKEVLVTSNIMFLDALLKVVNDENKMGYDKEIETLANKIQSKK